MTHEEGHEAYSPDPSKPIGSEHVAQFSDEVLRCLLTGNILRPGLFPSDNKLFGFGETSPDNSGEQRETSTEEIDCSPVILASLNDSQINDSGEKVATGVTLLENTTAQASSNRRHILKTSGRSTSPDAAHSNTKQTPDGQELLVRVDETRSKLEYHDQKAIKNQGPLSSITVGTETNDNGTQ